MHLSTKEYEIDKIKMKINEEEYLYTRIILVVAPIYPTIKTIGILKYGILS